jgi:periplasmic protein TonB
MSVAIATADDISLRRFLVYSAFLHGALAAAIGVSAYIQFRGNQWSATGAAQGEVVNANLVGSVGLPMPKPENFSDSHAVDPTKGLHTEEPKPPEIEQPKDQLEIPKFKDDKPPKPISHPSKVFVDQPRDKPKNAVDYGKGGNPNIHTGYSQTPGAGSPGVAMQGVGGGDFATRYGWYIEAVKRKINSNWDQFTIDSAVRSQRRAHAVMTFTINRDGSVKNVRLDQTSGNLSMDNSAQRALLSSVPMPALPNDYSGSYVNVIFDFDLSLSR